MLLSIIKKIMPKKILQDVLPPGVRSIRRIPIERDTIIKKVIRKMPEPSVGTSRIAHGRPASTRQTEKTPVLDEGVVRGGRRKTNYPKVILWVLACVSILFLAIATMLFFSSARVVVVPKSESLVLNTNFTAKKEPSAGELGYALMTLSKEGEEVVVGTAGKNVERRAIGNIILYNNFNSYSRKFLADTRLVAGNGKVYKLQSTVTIPGRTKVNGKFIPGSVQARVYGEKPGAEYNILLTDPMGDFRVVSFKGDPQYETFYGRQKTDIAGGIVSTTFTVSDAVAQSTRAKIRASIKEQVIKEAFAQKPPGFVLYYDDPLFVFESLPLVSRATSTVAMTERVKFSALLFKDEHLARAVASTTSKTLAGLAVEGIGIDSAVFSLVNKRESVSLATSKISFTLTGTTTLVAKIFPEKIAKDLVNKRTREFSGMILKHPEIEDADAVISPFWYFTFPDKSEKIKVVEKSKF
jgi:hypothetical protein